MRVLLTVPSLDVPKFKGLAKVSLKLVEGLKDKVDLEVLEVHKGGKGYTKYLKNLSYVPLKQLLSKVDIVHSTVPESATFLGLIKKIKNIKTVVTFHDLIPILEGRKLKFKLHTLINWYTLFMWKNAMKCDVVVANSSQTKEDVERFFGGKVHYVINPAVDEKFKPIKVKKEKPTLGFFSNFSYRKGLDKAIEVFKIVKKKIDCKLILAGGLLKTIYQRQFDVYELTKGLKDVEILGYIPENEIVRFYNYFDVYLFPSIHEGFGIPILEAQACGIPTLVFEWARIPKEAVEKAVKCKDVEDMARKVIELLENKEYYEKVRKEGMEYAKKFSWKNFVESYIKIYESLL